MRNAKELLKQTEATIKSLKEQLKNAEDEKFKLFKEIYGSDHEIIDVMPVYAKNALRWAGITKDTELKRFLDGEFEFEDFTSTTVINYKQYKKAKTPHERLMSFNHVGEKNASEAIRIAEEKGL